MRKINKIIIHCSDTPVGKNFNAKDIDTWHKQQGWECIGYHFVILLNGVVETGRPVEKIGSHCYGENHDSIGICYIGGKGGDTRTPEQKQSLKELIKKLCIEYKISPLAIHGHNEYNKSKTCPSFNVVAKDFF